MANLKSEILIAGIGNLFLGDDGFGCEVIQKGAARLQADNVRVKDFGVRGFDLAYTLMEPFELVILVDALVCGKEPGTLYVFEPDLESIRQGSCQSNSIELHSLDPERALGLVYQLGGQVRSSIRIVGCEPQTFGSDENPALGLSAPVRSAVLEAIDIIESLITDHFKKGENQYAPPHASQRRVRAIG